MEFCYEAFYAELMFYNGSILLESPVWEYLHRIVHFVSIEQEIIYAIELEIGFLKSFITNGNVGCVVRTQDPKLLLAE